MVEQLVPTGFVRYLPEFISVHAAFAAVILLKVMHFTNSAFRVD